MGTRPFGLGGRILGEHQRYDQLTCLSVSPHLTDKQCVRYNGYVSRDIAYATDIFSYGMLWWRMFHNNRDPLCFILERDGAVVNSDTKENLKAEVSFGKIVEDDITSKILKNETGVIVSRLVNKMLNLDPSTRVLQTIELLKSYDFIDVESIRQHYERVGFRVGHDTDEKLSIKIQEFQQNSSGNVSGALQGNVFLDCVSR